MRLTHDGIVIDLFCWKTNDLLELIVTAWMLLVFVFVNSWIVASFNLLCFCVWVRGEGCLLLGLIFFLRLFICACVCVRLCVRWFVAVFERVTVTYGVFVILKQTE